MDTVNKTWEKNRGFVAFIVTITLILLIGSGPFATQWNLWLIKDNIKPLPLQWRWIFIVIVMIGFLMIVGKWKTVRGYKDDQSVKQKTAGRWDGIFIDSRNKISLSQFQIVLWTVLALSAWMTLVLHRIVPILQHDLMELRVLAFDEVGKDENKDKEFETILIGILTERIKDKDLDNIKLKSLYNLLTSDENLPNTIDSIVNYDPLNVSFPSELLLAMGISTASLAGASIIKNNKSRTESGRSLELYNSDLKKAETTLKEKRDELDSYDMKIKSINAQIQTVGISEDTKNDLNSQLASLANERVLANQTVTDAREKHDALVKADKERAGLIHINEQVDDASWVDLLSGEKINDYQLIDIAKVQMFFFTIIIVFSYATLLWAQMSTNGSEYLLRILPTVSLHAFSDSLVTLLGLSHVGYLTVKNTG